MTLDPEHMKFIPDPGDVPMPAWMSAAAPDWFRAALDQVATPHRVEVAGCAINVREWGTRGQPGLLLVHGFAAHSHWWDYLAPAFARDWHVAALDLSGMGDSGHRNRYDFDTHLEELAAVCDALQFPAAVTLVGHSYGGFLACLAAARDPARYGAVVMIDSHVRVGNDPAPRRREAFGHTERNLYGSYAYALSRFRVVPEQPCEHPYVLAHIAPRSLCALGAGYTWKFDDRAFDLPPMGDLDAALLANRERLTILYATRSKVVTPAQVAHLRALLGTGTPLIPIEEADHHLFLNQPLAFLAALQALLGERRRHL